MTGYSNRSASVGSTAEARRAGMSEPPNAAEHKIKVATAIVAGSVGLVSYSCECNLAPQRPDASCEPWVGVIALRTIHARFAALVRATNLDWLEVKCPGPTGKAETFTEVPVDRYITITKGKGIRQRCKRSV